MINILNMLEELEKMEQEDCKMEDDFIEEFFSTIENMKKLVPLTDLINDTIKKVIFNPPATIVIWEDGTKTVSKARGGDIYSKEFGLVMCIIKKVAGRDIVWDDIFDKWMPVKKTHGYWRNFLDGEAFETGRPLNYKDIKGRQVHTGDIIRIKVGNIESDPAIIKNDIPKDAPSFLITKKYSEFKDGDQFGAWSFWKIRK